MASTMDSLFFTRFNFVSTYHPGSKNSKADTLSCLHDSLQMNTNSEPILPSSIILAPIHRDIMEEIHNAQQEEEPPTEYPPTRQYVPSAQRQCVMEWDHTALSTGYPGIQRTTQPLCNTFLWPSLATDVKNYVDDCLYPSPVA